MMNEPISSIMTTDLFTVGPDDHLAQARRMMIEHRIHHVPVVEGKTLVGLITTYDLFKLALHPDELDKIKVRDVMTKRLATLEPTDKIGAAAELLLEHLFHAIPIVSQGELKGIITTFDIMQYEFKKEYPQQFGK